MNSEKTMTSAMAPPQSPKNHGRIVSGSDEGGCLDSTQLDQLERSFRQWAQASRREDVRMARLRILVIFLLIRYTGAKLNEVLNLNPAIDIDIEKRSVTFRGKERSGKDDFREVHISDRLSGEIEAALDLPPFRDDPSNLLEVDPGFVRRKFYERVHACGIEKRLGGPEMIRKARGLELMRGNVPLPAVQQMLGHSTPNLTLSHVCFSPEEIRLATRVFIDREASRGTSARNSFFGKIDGIETGDIQSRISLMTITGYSIATIITNDSLKRLGLAEGKLITAEIKAPWIILESGDEEPKCSADNRLSGVIEGIDGGKVNTEYMVRISDGTMICAVISTPSARRLSWERGDRVWALFNAYAVVLRVD